ncbi:MAG: hypothetical protein KC656_16490 [Myxococcales bacterium]|nr:hypothetical protein [Myxococcales bacterium]MCB9668187.1 hypothetical protein [Alphaproteobacteria bacterium]MCB9692526.1 hypothetical protein [Alphaproteobacteria bacterium]
MGSASRHRVASNFVSRFGVGGLHWLVDALGRGESGQVIADHFDVSRERVRQWKNAFGQVVTLYQVHPEVAALLEQPEPVEAPAAPRSGAGVYLVEDGQDG